MITKAYSATLYGVDAKLIAIELSIISGTKLVIVGLPDNSVKESQHRIESVLKHHAKYLPRQRVIVNLAPASIKKEGAAYDLPIALAILHASQQEKLTHLSEYLIAGELSLDGELRPIRGALPMTIMAKKKGFKGCLLPKSNSQEAAVFDDLPIIPITHIQEAIDFLSGTHTIAPIVTNIQAIFAENQKVDPTLDLVDIKGQSNAKYALKVAAAGGHNLIMIGPPGVGKSMLAKRLPSILPPLTLREALETTKIYSVAGKMGDQKLITKRPFRSPHHTISEVALVGGGSIPKPGEISLAHHGVLALEELTEFKRSVLEVLRQPLEDKTIDITRTKMSVKFPASFMIVASMNPCPCGYYTHPQKQCMCNPTLRKRYLSKISGPLLDRIDIHLHIDPPPSKPTPSSTPLLTSATVRAEVLAARMRQTARFKDFPHIHCNAMMPPYLIRKCCTITTESQHLLNQAMEKLNLSRRAYDYILKLARTMADLDEQVDIQPEQIAEAISFRSLDKESWGN